MTNTRLRFYIGELDWRGRKVKAVCFNDVEVYLGTLYLGFTLYRTEGFWQGAHEPSRVYEVLTLGGPDPTIVSEYLAQVCGQRTGLVTVETVEVIQCTT